MKEGAETDSELSDWFCCSIVSIASEKGVVGKVFGLFAGGASSFLECRFLPAPLEELSLFAEFLIARNSEGKYF